MVITCTPIRQVFWNWQTEFRVLACQPSGDLPDGFTLNKYGNFTLSGTNIADLALFEETTITLKADPSSKYEANYNLVGVAGMAVDGDKIKIEPSQEYGILSRFMTAGQARNVNEAYPNFIQLVMDGKTDEIDYKKIKNVGKTYLNKYISKLSEERDKLMLLPVASEYGIDGLEDIAKIMVLYSNAADLRAGFETNPYKIICKHLEYPFERADKLILAHKPQWISTVERCEYACISILKRNEEEGDTRINANVLARFVKNLAPETIDKIVDAVTHSEQIYYDPATKYAALEVTYWAEALVAQEIRKRVDNPLSTPMEWEQFKTVDGFECTEEQTKILRLACEQSVMMLTGSAGSGKTSSMKALIRMLEANNYSYTIVAPTGIAAKRISETTGRHAATIHRFLTSEITLGDFLLVEETSMVGIQLLAMLFSRLSSYAKIIFICDPAQLTSISCGNIVQDIIDTGIVPTATLTKVFRYGIGGIATISTDTRSGTLFKPPYDFPDYTYTPCGENPVEQTLNAYEGLLQKDYDKTNIMVLCPYNKSNVGTYVLNAAIQNRYNLHPDSQMSYERDHHQIMFKVGDKVVNIVNDYHMPAVEIDENGQYVYTDEFMRPFTIPVMNGDIGYVREIFEGETPSMIVEFDNGFGIIDAKNIKNLLLGYALSIHRVQGAQAKAIILLVDKSHKSMLSRNLLYVGLSRAQKELVEIADVDVINAALKVEENKMRDTWLKDLLKENNHAS